MTDATNRKLDVDRTDDRTIARDDPLFELSQIIGYSRQPEPQHFEPEEQIDLEGELLRELESYPSFKPVARDPEPEPAPLPEPELPEIEEEFVPVEDFAPEFGAEIDEPVQAMEAVEAPKNLAAEADTLEAELMDLLGGLGERPSMPWTASEPKRVEPSRAEVEAETSPSVAESPQVPASAPFWFSDDSVDDEQAREPAPDEDSDILDAFESAMNEGFSLHFDESANQEVVEEPVAVQPSRHDVPAYAQPHSPASYHQQPGYEEPSYDEQAYEEPSYEEPAYQDEALAEPAYAEPAYQEAGYAAYEAPTYDEPAAEASAEDDFEFDLDLEDGFADETDYAVAQPVHEEDFAEEIEAVADEIVGHEAAAVPVLETAEMPAGEMEAMAPLDLPVLPEVEEKRPTAIDIERELDAALSGYDHFDHNEPAHMPNPAMRHAAAVAATTATTADNRLDFDIDEFEEDLARDLEFVNHDMAAQGDDEVDFPADEYADESAYAGYAANSEEQPRSRRGMVIAAVVGGIAILGAIGAFGLATGTGGGDSEPVLVKADPEPVKVVPEDPGGKQVPNQDRAVYGEVDGKTQTAPTQETLVSSSEEPIDLTGTGDPVLPTGVTETGKGEDRLMPDTAGSGTAVASAESPTAVLEPRRVRTVIVKPDGTLVANPDPVPVPTPAAVAAPAQPAATQPAASQPNGAVRTIDMAAQPATPEAVQPEAQAGFTAAPAPQTETIQTPSAAPSNDSLRALADAQPQQPAAIPQTAPAAVAQPIRTPGTIPERPVDQPVTVVNSQQPQVALAQPPAAPAAVPAPASGGYAVQIASQPSSESAQKTAQDLSRQYASTLGGRAISIQAAEIEGRGTFYRVRVAATSRQDAIALCEAYKRAGGSCFVAK